MKRCEECGFAYPEEFFPTHLCQGIERKKQDLEDLKRVVIYQGQEIERLKQLLKNAN